MSRDARNNHSVHVKSCMKIINQHFKTIIHNISEHPPLLKFQNNFDFRILHGAQLE